MHTLLHGCVSSKVKRQMQAQTELRDDGKYTSSNTGLVNNGYFFVVVEVVICSPL